MDGGEIKSMVKKIILVYFLNVFSFPRLNIFQQNRTILIKLRSGKHSRKGLIFPREFCFNVLSVKSEE